MFPHFKKINNESGIVLFIVLMTAIIIMIYSLGVLTQSANEINYAQQQIDQLTCEQLKKGYMWQWQASGTLPGSFPQVIPINGRNYTISWTNGPPASGLTPGSITCKYDTFQ